MESRPVRLYPSQYQYKEDYVHESLMCGSAKIIPLKGDLLHLTCRNFSDFQQKQLNYAKIWAIQRHQQGKSCHYLAIFGHTLWAFCKTGLLRAGFLDGKQGLLLACVNAQYTFTKYTALWSLELTIYKLIQNKEVENRVSTSHLYFLRRALA